MLYDLFMTFCLILILVFLYFCFHCASPIVCHRMKGIYLRKGFHYCLAIRKRDHFVDKVINILGFKKYFLVHRGQKNIENSTTLCINPIVVTSSFFRFDYPKLRMFGFHQCKCMAKISKDSTMIGTLIVPFGAKNDNNNITGEYHRVLLVNNRSIYINADQKNKKLIINYINNLLNKDRSALNSIWAIEFKINKISFLYNIDVLKAYRWDDDFSKSKKIEYTSNCIDVITNSINNFVQ